MKNVTTEINNSVDKLSIRLDITEMRIRTVRFKFPKTSKERTKYRQYEKRGKDMEQEVQIYKEKME